jgi:hypothetical protein
MPKKTVTNRRLIIAAILFLFGLSVAGLGQIGSGSLLEAKIIVVPFFGATTEQQPDPWVMRLEDFMRFGNPLYYWEQISN